MSKLNIFNAKKITKHISNGNGKWHIMIMANCLNEECKQMIVHVKFRKAMMEKIKRKKSDRWIVMYIHTNE